MTDSDIQSLLTEIQQDLSLYEEKNFSHRADIIDFLESQAANQAQQLLTALEEVDTRLFSRLQVRLRSEDCRRTAFIEMVGEYVDLKASHSATAETGYDNLDLFLHRLLPSAPMPEPTHQLEPGMVEYYKTPARLAFEWTDQLEFGQQDVFVDLGSGLGQITIIVNLLTGTPSIGIEIEPAFCTYAAECAAALNLREVSFIHTDARHADYSGGTIFFLFTPFKGAILQKVLSLLRKQAEQRPIRLIAYGPCITELHKHSWLKPILTQSPPCSWIAFESVS